MSDNQDVVGRITFGEKQAVSGQMNKLVSLQTWGCAHCNCSNKKEAKECINCKKSKKVGSPFSLSFAKKGN